jgi:hypothetical protein
LSYECMLTKFQILVKQIVVQVANTPVTFFLANISRMSSSVTHISLSELNKVLLSLPSNSSNFFSKPSHSSILGNAKAGSPSSIAVLRNNHENNIHNVETSFTLVFHPTRKPS